MRLDDFRTSTNVDDRRGQEGGGGGFRLPVGGGRLGIVGILVVLVVSYVTGISPLTLIGAFDSFTQGGGGFTQGDPGQISAPSAAQSGHQGVPNDATGQFVARVLGATEDTWTEIFQQQLSGRRYQPPALVLFSNSTVSACGTARAAMGPFYCPNDRKVYLDTSFFEQMRTRFQACPTAQGACAFAQAYVIAHEIGHHVQHQLGVLQRVQQARERARDEAEANALSVRLELMADCLAGLWTARTNDKLRFLQRGDIEAALQTANAIGDDMLQRRSRGYVVPDSFTHGTSAQRQHWFTVGLNSGQIDACDTFKR